MNRRACFVRLGAIVAATALAPVVQSDAPPTPGQCQFCVSGRPAYRHGLCVEHLCIQARLRGMQDGQRMETRALSAVRAEGYRDALDGHAWTSRSRQEGG